MIDIEAPPTDAPPGGWGPQSLLIRQIRRDGGTQARVGSNEDTVQEYAELMREQRWNFRALSRPIVLYDGSAFWLADGFHRIEAAQRAGLTDYLVDVIRGTQRDAILRAAGANSEHGLRRTNADKRRAVELLLRDEEWRQWSDRKIADVCAVSDKTVAAIRRDLGAEFPHLTTRQGADGKSYPVAPKPSGAINRPDGSPLNDAPPAAERVALVAAHQAELADMQQRFRALGWKLTPHGLWFKLSRPDGTLYATVEDLAVHFATLEKVEARAAYVLAQSEAPAATPPLNDILLRLDAHGYAKTTTREKGGATLYSFRDFSGQHDDTGGEIEMAEGELGYWLDELDTSAAYAQAKQERFIDARGRAEALGYDLRRDGSQFELTPAGKRVPALRGTLDQLIKTIEGYEKNAAKSAAASAESDSKAHIAKEHEDQSLLSTAKANIAIGNIGDARRLLGQVQVSIWERDQLLRTLDVADARRFLADQRERLTRFSPTAMVSQTTWRQALDHIQALLEVSE